MHKLMMIALLAGVSGLLAAEDIAIVNTTSGVASLTSDQVKDLFLGKKTSWDDGSKVVVIIVKGGSESESLFKFLGKSEQQFQTTWKKIIFTGKGSMPDMVDSNDAVVEKVAKTPGAIGFVDKAKAKDTVKAIAVQ